MITEARKALDSLESRVGSIELADSIGSKRDVMKTLHELDRDCEVSLDLIHSLQQRSSGLSPALLSEVEALITRHSNLSAHIQVCKL